MKLKYNIMKKITYYLFLFAVIMYHVNMIGQSAELIEGATQEVAPKTNVVIPFTGTYNDGTRGTLIYDNGPHFNVPGSPNISLLEDQALGMNTLGNNVNLLQTFSIADDVVLTENYDVTAIDLYCYQTNAPNISTITAVYVQVWDGDPAVAGSIIWGDFTTNLIDTTDWSETYRHSETNPGTARAIFITRANTTGLSLTAGTYWLHWTFEGDIAFSGPWQPPISILGQGTTGNAQQFDGSTWVPLADTGSGDLMGSPFQMYGSEILDVNDIVLNDQINLFPNPSNEQITISNTSNISLESAEIYDVQGKLLHIIDLSSMGSEKSIDVSTFAVGTYMVQISSEAGSVTKRFIKR
jgi:Secretion system C-terminal sorting domain